MQRSRSMVVLYLLITFFQLCFATESNVGVAPVPIGEFAGYMTLEQLANWQEATHKLNAQSGLTKYYEAGRSLEGRPINAFCVGMCNGGAAGEVFYNGMHHSREPLGTMSLVYFIELLLRQYHEADPETVHLLRTRALWFILVVNPDGYVWNRKHHPNGGGMQRKNRRPGCKDTGDLMGVDLNRNYPFCFDEDKQGSSTNPCQDDYEGPAPFSEPESRLVRDFVDAHNFSVAFNYHSFGRALYIPYSCRPKHEPEHPDDTFFHHMAAELSLNNHFKWGQPWNSGLYTVNGDAADWMYSSHRIFAVSPEVAPQDPVPSDKYGFWPPKEKVIAWSKENLHMNRHGAWRSGPLARVHELSVRRSSDHVGLSVELIVVNEGTRDTTGNVEVVVTGFNDTSSSVATASRVTALLGKSQPIVMRLARGCTYDGDTLSVAVRDDLHCVLYHVVCPSSVEFGRSTATVSATANERRMQPDCGECSALFDILGVAGGNIDQSATHSPAATPTASVSAPPTISDPPTETVSLSTLATPKIEKTPCPSPISVMPGGPSEVTASQIGSSGVSSSGVAEIVGHQNTAIGLGAVAAVLFVGLFVAWGRRRRQKAAARQGPRFVELPQNEKDGDYGPGTAFAFEESSGSRSRGTGSDDELGFSQKDDETLLDSAIHFVMPGSDDDSDSNSDISENEGESMLAQFELNDEEETVENLI